MAHKANCPWAGTHVLEHYYALLLLSLHTTILTTRYRTDMQGSRADRVLRVLAMCLNLHFSSRMFESCTSHESRVLGTLIHEKDDSFI